MYEDRKEKFSFKSFFLTLLLVLLFVFVMLWLFPTKSYIDEKMNGTYDFDKLSVLYDEIFSNNIEKMKDGAIGYFTNERLPQTVGQSKKLTLQQMYDLHLVLKLRDKNGDACDTTKSYVEITKYEDEYRLKVNLSCGDDEDYIIVYLGCYNYCNDGVCERRTYVKSTSVSKSETKKTIEEKKEEPKPIIKKYMYEYKLVIDGYSKWTEWSMWQKESVTSTKTVEVEKREESLITGYKTVKVQTGVKTSTIKTGESTEKVKTGETTELVKTGTRKIQTGTTTQTTTEKVKVGTVEKISDVKSGTTVPSNTSTTKYEVIGSTTQSTCSNCAEETVYTWNVISIEPVYDVQEKTTTVPVYKTIDVYTKKTVPVYSYKTVEQTKTVSTPVYVTKTVPVYSNATYYRYRKYITIEGSTTIKWSYSKTDTTLIAKGYKLTGNVKQV